MSELRIAHPQFAELSNVILARGEAIKFKAFGTSMLPFIKDGDVLTVFPVEDKHWSLGQIVFYQSMDQKLLAHRIIRKTFANGVWHLGVRGDAMKGIAEEISADQVLGQVVYRQRNDKSVKMDSGWWGIAGVAWVVATGTLRWIRKWASKIKRTLQQFINK